MSFVQTSTTFPILGYKWIEIDETDKTVNQCYQFTHDLPPTRAETISCENPIR